jgi:hypothetical protein
MLRNAFTKFPELLFISDMENIDNRHAAIVPRGLAVPAHLSTNHVGLFPPEARMAIGRVPHMTLNCGIQVPVSVVAVPAFSMHGFPLLPSHKIKLTPSKTHSILSTFTTQNQP